MKRCSCGRKIKTKKAKVCRRCRRLKFKAMNSRIADFRLRRQVAQLQDEAGLT